jgi:hypothetical protein
VQSENTEPRVFGTCCWCEQVSHKPALERGGGDVGRSDMSKA